MKKSYFAIGLAVLALLMTAAVFVGQYDAQITNDELATEAWGNVETNYQRRADLIPNLVATVKGYATHEQEVLTAVTEARASVNNITLDIKNASPAQLAAFQNAQENLGSALSRLLVTIEKYPELKANEQFSTLMVQLEGTENRINIARRDYNAAARKINTQTRSFFGRFVANFSGVKYRPMFEASKGAEKSPTVKFD